MGHPCARNTSPPFGGGAPTPLTPSPARARLSSLVALPDGGFAFGRTPDRGVTDTWRVDAAGKQNRLTVMPILPAGTPRYGTHPLAIAPEGGRLLLAHRQTLAVVALSGGKPAILRALPGQAAMGAWLT